MYVNIKSGQVSFWTDQVFGVHRPRRCVLKQRHGDAL